MIELTCREFRMARSCFRAQVHHMGSSCSRRHPVAEALPEVEPAEEPVLVPSGDDEVVAPRGTRGSRRTLADRCRVRYYAVWHVAGARHEIVGLHSGTIEAWRHIASGLPGGRYLPGHRLRRYSTLEAAVDGYYAEAARHGAPIPPNLYVHP